ncbi:hypothetical protein GEMRC1_006740 [Eukaryota sp. GEM-RC1]
MNAYNFIGKPVSIITKSELRYEGILYTIDANAKAVALQNVRCFGTEGRGDKQVPGVDDLHSYIVFSGSQIKECSLLEEEPILGDPAIVSVGEEPTVTPVHEPSTHEPSSHSEVKSTKPSPSSQPPRRHDGHKPAFEQRPRRETNFDIQG